MDDEPIDYPKEEALRYRMETSKERSILIRNWAYTVISIIVAVMLIWALWSWRAVNNMTGATQAKLNGILDKLDSKIDTLDTKNANDVLIEVKGAVADLRKTERELPGLIIDLRQEIVGLSRGVQARLQTLDGGMLESQRQIKQNGDATAAMVARSDASVNDKLLPAVTESVKATNVLMAKFGATADEAAAAIRLASEKTGKSIDELNKVIANTNDVVLTANATLVDVHTDLHDTMKQMPHVMAQVDKTATNISKFSKISIIAGIISNLANGFIPGLLH